MANARLLSATLHFYASFQPVWSPEEVHGELLTAKGGTIAPYSPAPSGFIFAMRDEDGDGRPDLLLHSSASEDCIEDHPEGKCVRVWGPTIVFRSLADGTFAERPDADDGAGKPKP